MVGINRGNEDGLPYKQWILGSNIFTPDFFIYQNAKFDAKTNRLVP